MTSTTGSGSRDTIYEVETGRCKEGGEVVQAADLLGEHLAAPRGAYRVESAESETAASGRAPERLEICFGGRELF